MKRFALLGFGLLASVLAGCPVFSGDGQQGGNPVCTTGDCSGFCSQPTDCPVNETCGSDGQCHSGDCSFSGCPSGFQCITDPRSQTAICEATGAGGGSVSSSTGSTMGSTTSTGAGGSSSSTGGSATSSSSSSGVGGTGGAPPKPVYCGHPSDCANGTICGKDGTCQPGPCSATNTCVYGYSCVMGACQSPTQGACNSDADCSGGSVCIAGSDGKGGVCTAPANQCFDQSQCAASENCVNGKCTLGNCKTNSDCRDGFTCNTSTGVCSGIAQTCNVTNDCGKSSEVCVDGACVPRSNGGACSNPNDVWDENGCIPNQAASFICQNDGVKDACATGSICLHHDCWISCDAPMQNACANQPQLNTCKPVTEGSTSYNVCGSSTNLGNQCGAGANNMTCTGGGQVCIDGFCK